MMEPRPRYGRSKSADVNAAAPGMALESVGSWYCGRYAVPVSGAFRSRGCCPAGTEIVPNATELKLCAPTYDTSKDEDHGNTIWTPPFHVNEDPIFAS